MLTSLTAFVDGLRRLHFRQNRRPPAAADADRPSWIRVTAATPALRHQASSSAAAVFSHAVDFSPSYFVSHCCWGLAMHRLHVWSTLKMSALLRVAVAAVAAPAARTAPSLLNVMDSLE